MKAKRKHGRRSATSCPAGAPRGVIFPDIDPIVHIGPRRCNGATRPCAGTPWPMSPASCWAGGTRSDLVRNARLWAATNADRQLGADRRPGAVDHPGHHPGRPDRLRAVLHAAERRPAAGLAENPLTVFKIWEGGMSFHGGFLGGVRGHRAGSPASSKIDMLKPGRPGRAGRADRPVLRPLRQLHQRRAVGPGHRPSAGAWCSATTPSARGPAYANKGAARPASTRAIPASCTRRRWRVLVLFLILNFAAYRLKRLQRRGALVATFLIWATACSAPCWRTCATLTTACPTSRSA